MTGHFQGAESGQVVRQVLAAAAPLRRDPVSSAALDTEALAGERVIIHDEMEGWAEVTLMQDGYRGFVPVSALGESAAVTHRVSVPRTFVYPGPSIKLPPLDVLPLHAHVTATVEGDFGRVPGGFIYGAHLLPVSAPPAPDFVAVAERFLEVPYLWGGKTAGGIDCSGLVQLSMAVAGMVAPRDSGPQARDLGRVLSEDEALRRGDLVFWPGHVGIMRDADTLLHASGYHMLVVSEPLAQATARIEAQTGAPISAIRRLRD